MDQATTCADLSQSRSQILDPSPGYQTTLNSCLLQWWGRADLPTLEEKGAMVNRLSARLAKWLVVVMPLLNGA
jgi:hypothetical protein